MSEQAPVDILIVGFGWTGTFLAPLLTESSISYAATTTSGRDNTIPFTFDPASTDPAPYTLLPPTKTILITFPLKVTSAPDTFSSLYSQTHPETSSPNYILLGSSGIWSTSEDPATSPWITRHTPPTPPPSSQDRFQAEQAAIAQKWCILNLAGLWGDKRQPRNWVTRTAPTKTALSGKGSLHLVHGADVARAIVAVHQRFTPGERWLLTDATVYDWWHLASAWGDGGFAAKGLPPTGEQIKWVRELMEEKDVRALPRDASSLGRVLDSREFWKHFGLEPLWSRADDGPLSEGPGGGGFCMI
ncbi:hypothetical protein HDV00_011416 [Rhizophlyctis rosea]|nr:hypothetical protein HDV00_011416 [Rhizophlyctis rosea]